MRPWFLGHILVELLLDDELARREPALLDRYYDLIAPLDGAWVAGSVEQISGRGVGRLAHFIDRYAEVQFLRDYREDESLKDRLDQVMSRVGLEELPAEFLSLLPSCRQAIHASYNELIHREN